MQTSALSSRVIKVVYKNKRRKVTVYIDRDIDQYSLYIMTCTLC